MSLHGSPLAPLGFSPQWQVHQMEYLLEHGWTRTPDNQWINPQDGQTHGLLYACQILNRQLKGK